jgi:hypothetical protein
MSSLKLDMLNKWIDIRRFRKFGARLVNVRADQNHDAAAFASRLHLLPAGVRSHCLLKLADNVKRALCASYACLCDALYCGNQCNTGLPGLLAALKGASAKSWR